MEESFLLLQKFMGFLLQFKETVYYNHNQRYEQNITLCNMWLHG